MMPASFAIPYLLTAPLPPALTISVAPADDAACAPDPHPCFATVGMRARNGSNRTLLLDDLDMELSRARPAGYHRPYNPPVVVPPFGEVPLPDRWALHGNAPHQFWFAYHAEGEPPRRRRVHSTIMSEHWLEEAAFVECRRCNGGREAPCACRTRDAGRRCTEARQCESACLFDRLEQLSDPVCAAPNARCAAYPPAGFRVGHCSPYKAPTGCPAILTADDSESRPISMLSGSNVKCWDEAVRVTESSPRR